MPLIVSPLFGAAKTVRKFVPVAATIAPCDVTMTRKAQGTEAATAAAVWPPDFKPKRYEFDELCAFGKDLALAPAAAA